MPTHHRPGPATRTASLAAFLVAANLASWLWAVLAFRHHPVLLGTGLLAYGFGLRHAVDADHIAAIDNSTRKLMAEGRRPVATGFFFSLGHSTVVVLATVAIALTATAYRHQFAAVAAVGGVLGTVISAAFLFAIALANLAVLRTVWADFRRARTGQGPAPGEQPAPGGLLSRLFRPLFGLITRSWHMYPLGVLFGLGFDTATEVGLLGISAAQATAGLPIWSILVFPALFTAAMSLVDTADGILMLGTYGWAFRRPIRRLYYNLTVTAVSILVALLVGGLETLGLIGDQLSLRGLFWNAVGQLNTHFGSIGILVVAVFAASWLISALIYRFKRYDDLGADA